MIKVSFQYDSSDPTAASFFNWLSDFPLDQSVVRLDTSIDLVDSDSNGSEQKVHHIGKIVLQACPEESDDYQVDVSQMDFDFSSTSLPNNSHDNHQAPVDLPAFSGNSPADFEKETDFASDMDDFLLQGVLFGDEEDEQIVSPMKDTLPASPDTIPKQSTFFKWKSLFGKSKSSSLINQSKDIIKNNSNFADERSSGNHATTNSQPFIFSEQDREMLDSNNGTLDFLLNALEDFDQ